MSIKLVIAGAAGRMGQALQRALAEAKDFALIAALKRGDEPLPALANAQAVIDFTSPSFSVGLAAQAAETGVAHIIGTTGFSAQDETAIEAAARRTAIVKSANMSLGVNLLAALVKQAAQALPQFDIEILEMHHRMKADAPSGTALLLGEAAARGRNMPLRRDIDRNHKRSDGAIGFASLRGGTVVGEHEAVFAGPQERLVLKHIAEDRMIFANGALAAARWSIGKKPGLYAMQDVLGL